MSLLYSMAGTEDWFFTTSEGNILGRKWIPGASIDGNAGKKECGDLLKLVFDALKSTNISFLNFVAVTLESAAISHKLVQADILYGLICKHLR